MSPATASLPEGSSEPANADMLRPGTVLSGGAYTVTAYLNSGGFGITYLATDSLGRTVVIKECYPATLCRRDGHEVRLRSGEVEEHFAKARDLFMKEAHALAGLTHRSVVGVHQIFEENNTAYMALDHIDGPDLFDLYRSSPQIFTPAECTRIATALLDALTYIHALGILHRDIAPDNILLRSDKTPVLIDFGAARTGAARTTRIVTEAHSVKDGYSPQEFYLNSTPQGRSSDLYALAATLHHLVKGAPPPNAQYRLARVAEGSPDPYVPLVGTMPGFDGRFLEAIDRCLSLFPKDRMSSAAQWRDFLVTERRVVIPGVRGPVPSGGLERRISSLVAETNLELAAEDAQPAPQVDTPEDHIPNKRPDPHERDPDYWAILNEDPDELAREAAKWREAEERRQRRAERPGLLGRLLPRRGA